MHHRPRRSTLAAAQAALARTTDRVAPRRRALLALTVVLALAAGGVLLGRLAPTTPVSVAAAAERVQNADQPGARQQHGDRGGDHRREKKAQQPDAPVAANAN